VARVHVELRYPVLETDSDALGKFALTLRANAIRRRANCARCATGYANFKLGVAVRAGETTDLGDLVLPRAAPFRAAWSTTPARRSPARDPL
jgi:hypothetical protein